MKICNNKVQQETTSNIFVKSEYTMYTQKNVSK